MPNPNPRTDHPAFIAAQFQRAGDEPLAKMPVQVRLPESLNSIVTTLPNRSEWLRRVIAEAAQRELMQGDKS
ncbi:MAG: hypothetical protein WCD18_03730 [Thermosynechococcaceae cyanobacterium]